MLELFPDPRSQAILDRHAAVEKLLYFVNGDIRNRRTEHYECGCCLGEDGHFDRSIAVDNVCTAIVGAGLLGGICKVTPSTGRWWSRNACMSFHAAGIMFHWILPRTFAATYPSPQRMILGRDEEDFKKILKAKTIRSVFYLTKDDTPISAALTLICTEPVEHLARVVQKLDEKGGILRCLRTSQNPFTRCLKVLSTFLCLLTAASVAMPLFYHFGASEKDGSQAEAPAS